MTAFLSSSSAVNSHQHLSVWALKPARQLKERHGARVVQIYGLHYLISSTADSVYNVNVVILILSRRLEFVLRADMMFATF
jgi:hypothetical protein